MYNEALWVSQQQKIWGVAWISLSQLTVEGQTQQDCCSQRGASHVSMWTASRAGLSRGREGWAVWSPKTLCPDLPTGTRPLERWKSRKPHYRESSHGRDYTQSSPLREETKNQSMDHVRVKRHNWGETRASPKQDGRDTWVWAPGRSSKVIYPPVQHQFCSLPRGSSQVLLHTSCCWQTLGSGSRGGEVGKRTLVLSTKLSQLISFHAHQNRGFHYSF